MQDKEKGILTYKGRVVYDRKRKGFTWCDVYRISKSLQGFENDWEKLCFLRTQLQMSGSIMSLLEQSPNLLTEANQRIVNLFQWIIDELIELLPGRERLAGDQQEQKIKKEIPEPLIQRFRER